MKMIMFQQPRFNEELGDEDDEQSDLERQSNRENKNLMNFVMT